jgi:signal transduction histidine kinase
VKKTRKTENGTVVSRLRPVYEQIGIALNDLKEKLGEQWWADARSRRSVDDLIRIEREWASRHPRQDTLNTSESRDILAKNLSEIFKRLYTEFREDLGLQVVSAYFIPRYSDGRERFYCYYCWQLSKRIAQFVEPRNDPLLGSIPEDGLIDEEENQEEFEQIQLFNWNFVSLYFSISSVGGITNLLFSRSKYFRPACIWFPKEGECKGIKWAGYKDIDGLHPWVWVVQPELCRELVPDDLLGNMVRLAAETTKNGTDISGERDSIIESLCKKRSDFLQNHQQECQKMARDFRYYWLREQGSEIPKGFGEAQIVELLQAIATQRFYCDLGTQTGLFYAFPTLIPVFTQPSGTGVVSGAAPRHVRASWALMSQQRLKPEEFWRFSELTRILFEQAEMMLGEAWENAVSVTAMQEALRHSWNSEVISLCNLSDTAQILAQNLQELVSKQALDPQDLEVLSRDLQSLQSLSENAQHIAVVFGTMIEGISNLRQLKLSGGSDNLKRVVNLSLDIFKQSLEYRACKNPEDYQLKTQVDSVEISYHGAPLVSLLRELLANAWRALVNKDNRGEIAITVTDHGNSFSIRVWNSSPAIPEEIVETVREARECRISHSDCRRRISKKLEELGMSFGERHHLGLAAWWRCVEEAWGGEFKIVSGEEGGTLVEVVLPKSAD